MNVTVSRDGRVEPVVRSASPGFTVRAVRRNVTVRTALHVTTYPESVNVCRAGEARGVIDVSTSGR